MKKYAILTLITAAAIAAILAGGAWRRESVREVEAVTVTLREVQQTVLCNGTVQPADSTEVQTEYPCIVDEVTVKAGDRVEAGDRLFTVDTARTVAAVRQAGLADSLSGVVLPKEITAPCAGYVTALNVQSGGTTDGKNACAVISENTQSHIGILIGENQLRQIAVGQEAEISGAAFARDCYHGTVTAIDEAAHTSYIGTAGETVVGAVVTLPAAEMDDSLRLGLNAKASIIVSRQEAALVAPYDCVGQDNQNREFVYVINGGRAERRFIVTGAELADGFLVTEGLNGGEQLVRSPAALTDDSTAVRVKGGDAA